MSRKLLSLGVALVVLIGLASVSVGQETITIRLANFTAGAERVNELNAMIAAFEAENPNVEVEVTITPFDDYFTMLQADYVAGEPPDVYELNYENFVAFAANDVLLDVSEYLDPDVPYYPGALAAFQYEGVQYALPETFSTVVLYYNKDLFDQAGVDYPTPEWTWADALEAALAIRALDEDIWGIIAPIQFWEFYKRAAQNGCEFFNEDRTESTINAPECVEALEIMLSLLETDAMPDEAELAGTGDSQLFQEGRLGMLVAGIWVIPNFVDVEFAWDIEVEPGISQKAYHFFSNGVAVDVNTDHPEEAVALAQFLTSSETAVQIRLEANWELPALDSPELFASYLAQTPPDNRAAIFASLENPVPPPVIERQSEMQGIMQDLLGAAVNGEIDAQTALDLAKEEIDQLLGD